MIKREKIGNIEINIEGYGAIISLEIKSEKDIYTKRHREGEREKITKRENVG